MDSRPRHVSADAAALQALHPLRRAEEIVLLALREGDVARVGLRRPLVPTADNTLRGAFVACLARGGSGDLQAGRSLQIMGAWIEGRVDLHDEAVAESLWFYRCVFDSTPRVDGARIHGSLSFSDCLLPGLRAEDCEVAEDLSLNAGTTVRTEVRLARARIGRHLDCERASLRSAERAEAPWRRRLTADGARIGGNVMISGGFEAHGEVSLVRSRVGGDVRATGARLSARLEASGVRGDALNLERAQVGGQVRLDDGFCASGTVSLTGTRIDGDLRCTGAEFDLFGEAAYAGTPALRLDGARIGGTLALAGLKHPLAAASLAGTRAAVLHDDAGSWGERLVLDGFRYGRLAAGTPADAALRVQWLAQQDPAHLDEDFRPGPWRELIAALRRSGHEHAASEVAMARERHLSRVGRVGLGASPAARGLTRLAHDGLGLLAGYGYRPARVLGVMTAVWVACGALYVAATQAGALATVGAAGVPAPAVRPFMLSLDLLLPIVDLQQGNHFAAVGSGAFDAQDASLWRWAARSAAWFEVVFGWVALFVFLGALAGLFDRDRHQRND
jgi:hypothetical protein